MNKYLKWTIIVIAIIGLGLFITYKVFLYQTKQQSPEEFVQYTANGYNIEVFYNRPSKKGREIFGGLVPYGDVWRTGANEATTFETLSDLLIDGKTLKAGKYTLWTIPQADSWTVIFNKKQYSWGVNGNGASREAEHDALKVVVPVQELPTETEQFTILLLSNNATPILELRWDKTQVSVPMLK